MEPISMIMIAAAGFAGGAINALAGGGSLVTFPALLAIGLPPIAANITNTAAALPGYVGGVWGYRRELAGHGRRIVVLGAVTAVGAMAGSALLLLGNEDVFTAVIPWLILLSVVLLAVQPYLASVVSRRVDKSAPHGPKLRGASWGQFGVAVYGGYFNAGLGIMMLGVLGVFLSDSLQKLNALKSVLSVVASAVSLGFFAVFATVSWPEAAIMAIAGLIGGWSGAAVGRRLPVALLRWSIVTFGFIIFIVLLVDHAS
ncbi:sulfite exporter TauE/SafE family protein [Microbacterium murale]|uniref:Probable membrane transporter protein n=1 Tax=Microbacterium murale TaxID=1081040 RepID=A0ABQ1RUP4_9MICO|nr:sulfite exporter TauE/SafE family protein [Microbacterium murale]GGD78891.1 UPF0721 transmembrane protein [Microbacterium murale]